MPAFVDRTGCVYGRLTALRLANPIRGRVAWHCRCACGIELGVMGQSLQTGNTKSCGCLNEEVRSTRTALRNRANAGKQMWSLHGHMTGHKRTPTYNSWMAMKERCDRPKRRNTCYAGISICDRWRDFRNFLADMGDRPAGTTLDRENPFGNYEPGNCRWATSKQQRQNTRKAWLARASVIGAFNVGVC